MTRNNLLLIAVVLGLVVALGVVKVVQSKRQAARREPIVLYLPSPHPYCDAVAVGARAFARETGTGVRVAVGQEGTQANVNANVESLFTVGYRAFSIYPLDPAGTRGLVGRLTRAGCVFVGYGAQPEAGTDMPFAVATDTRAAATLAAEKLIELMGRRGRILNVLEGMTDANTAIRKEAIEAVVAKYPDVQILQTIGDVTTEQKALEKMESALVARGDEVDGIICTGYTTTVAGAMLLSERHKDPMRKRVRFVGLDTDERVIAAIRNGHIDATIAQNPYGHGYITCTLLKLMLDGWTPVERGYQFIDSGTVAVTRENLDTYEQDIRAVTARIVAAIKSKYLKPPGD
jgi:ribose transport system substrate-binding protein